MTFVDYAGTDLDTTYVYDDPLVDFSLSRLTAIERHGQSVEYSYDRFGRVTQDGELSYDHDANGNRVEIGYPGGVTATYTYDFADRQATLDVDPGTGTPEPVVTPSSHLPSGPLASLGLGNGTTEMRDYDGRYAPEEILLDAPRPHSWTYTTDGVGNVTEITEVTGCLAPDLVLENQTVNTMADFQSCAAVEAGPAFAVDSPGDVTFTAGTRVVLKDGFSVGSGARFVAGVDPALAGATETKSFTYQDVQYFLAGADLPWTSLTWTFDKIGNRLTETRDGITDTYAYVANGATGNTAILDQVTLGIGGTRDYTYGPAGHLEEVAAGANVVDFNSDEEGRLSEISRTGGSSSPFDYDGRSFLNQAGELATVGVTRPVYSSEGLVMALRRQASAAEPELTAHVLYFAGRPVAQLEVGGAETRWWYFTTDHLGTPQVATDETGAETWNSRLEPFGRDSMAGTLEGALANDVFLRLPGQWETETWQDAALGAGVYYNVHRWYQPGVGNYTRVDPDPLVDPTVQHPYSYSRQRPLTFVDLLGLRITHVDRSLEQMLKCAVRHGAPQFRQAFTWTLKQPRDWEIRTLTSTRGSSTREGRRRIPGTAPCFGHAVDRDSGIFLVDTREPSCECIIEGIVREITELYAHEQLGLGADTPFGFGGASEFADPVVKQTQDKACHKCECLDGFPSNSF